MPCYKTNRAKIYYLFWRPVIDDGLRLGIDREALDGQKGRRGAVHGVHQLSWNVSNFHKGLPVRTKALFLLDK